MNVKNLRTVAKQVASTREVVDAVLIDASHNPSDSRIAQFLLAASWSLRAADFNVQIALGEADDVVTREVSQESTAKPAGGHHGT